MRRLKIPAGFYSNSFADSAYGQLKVSHSQQLENWQVIRHEHGDGMTQTRVGQSIAELLGVISHLTLSNCECPLPVSCAKTVDLAGPLVPLGSGTWGRCPSLWSFRPFTWQLLGKETNMRALRETGSGHLDRHMRLQSLSLLCLTNLPSPESLLGLLAQLESSCRLNKGPLLMIFFLPSFRKLSK